FQGRACLVEGLFLFQGLLDGFATAFAAVLDRGEFLLKVFFLQAAAQFWQSRGLVLRAPGELGDCFPRLPGGAWRQRGRLALGIQRDIRSARLSAAKPSTA